MSRTLLMIRCPNLTTPPRSIMASITIDNVNTEVLEKQYAALVELLQDTGYQDDLLWGLVDMLEITLYG